MTQFLAEVFIELYPTELGGRSAALNLCKDNHGQYRPHLRVIKGSGVHLGVAFMNGPNESILPGNNTHATIKSLYEPNVSYDELTEGAEFEILEGANVIGHGKVIKR